jgi:spore coat polysaccharide biosynthesis protein SpsF (cytidylyltransferase family)
MQLIDIERRITILESQVKYLMTSKYLNSICLAIADEKDNYGFADLAEKNGWNYIFGDPQDVLGRILKAVEKFGTETVLRDSTENPFVYSERIDELYKEHIAGNFDYSMFSDLPEGAGFSIIQANALRISHKLGSSRHRSELVTSYIFDNKSDFKMNIRTPEKEYMRSDVRLTVDYPEDLIFCRKIYRDLNGRERLIPVSEIIDYWDRNEDLRRPVENIGIDWGHGRLWK